MVSHKVTLVSISNLNTMYIFCLGNVIIEWSPIKVDVLLQNPWSMVGSGEAWRYNLVRWRTCEGQFKLPG
jgi:hypothetical protein